jgi:hypothetical protein
MVSDMQYPYPETSYCSQPHEDPTTRGLTRPLPTGMGGNPKADVPAAASAPPKPGSAAWVTARSAPAATPKPPISYASTAKSAQASSSAAKAPTQAPVPRAQTGLSSSTFPALSPEDTPSPKSACKPPFSLLNDDAVAYHLGRGEATCNCHHRFFAGFQAYSQSSSDSSCHHQCME